MITKNLGLFPEDITNHEFELKTDGKFSMIYKATKKDLNFNSVDFGDLITLPVKLFKNNWIYLILTKKV